MVNPLSIAASIAGLMSLAETFIQLTSGYVMDVKSCASEFKALSAEVEGLCGVLLTLQRAIARQSKAPFAPPSEEESEPALDRFSDFSNCNIRNVPHCLQQ